MTTKLKLVGAKTYYCEAFRGGFVLEGGVVELDDKKLVRALLKETYMDALNNVHPVFTVTEDPVAVAAPDEDDLDDADEDGDVLGEVEAAPAAPAAHAAPVPKKPRTRAAS
jgi:hypothetical protein